MKDCFHRGESTLFITSQLNFSFVLPPFDDTKDNWLPSLLVAGQVMLWVTGWRCQGEKSPSILEARTANLGLFCSPPLKAGLSEEQNAHNLHTSHFYLIIPPKIPNGKNIYSQVKRRLRKSVFTKLFCMIWI